MTEPDREGFLRRWARVKEEAPFSEAPPAEQGDADPAAASGGNTDVATASDVASEASPPVELPRLEDITPEGSIARFLEKQVPDALRRAALRQAWRLDPVISTFIEVAENQYDFNDPTGVPGFGPLPADTDMAALLRHALGTVEKAETKTGEEAITAHVAADVTSVADAPGKAIADGGASADGVESASMRLTDAGAALPMPGQQTEKPQQEAVIDEEFTPANRLRRHGGALPS